MRYFWIGVIGGIVSYAHCLGMCGGFPLQIAAGRKKVLPTHLAWHAGKMFAYIFLGAVAGFAGSFIGALFSRSWIQSGLAFAAGIIMAASGVMLLGMTTIRAENGGRLAELFASFFIPFFRGATPGSAMVLGIGCGCLPCPIVIGFLALSMETASPTCGILTMAGLGAGTFISLMPAVIIGRLLPVQTRRWSSIAGGIILLLLGILTIARGSDLYHRLIGCRQPAVIGSECTLSQSMKNGSTTR